MMPERVDEPQFVCSPEVLALIRQDTLRTIEEAQASYVPYHLKRVAFVKAVDEWFAAIDHFPPSLMRRHPTEASTDG